MTGKSWMNNETPDQPSFSRCRAILVLSLLGGLALSGCVEGDDVLFESGPPIGNAPDPETEVMVEVDATDEGVQVSWSVDPAPTTLKRLVFLAAENPVARANEDFLYEKWTVDNPPLRGFRVLELPVGLWYVIARAEAGTGETAWSQEQTITVAEPETAETAPPLKIDAGADQRITDSDDTGKATFTLIGTANPQSGHKILRYEWLEGEAKLRTTFMSTFTRPIGTHEFTFQVTYEDGSGIQKAAQDQVQVRILPNQPPRSDAGGDIETRDQDGSGRADILLDGSASTDPDGKIESYEWKLNGATVLSTEQDTIKLRVGTHTVTLTVRDNGGAESTDTLTATVHPTERPVAHAQADPAELIDLDGSDDETVTLDATQSFHPGGTITSYNWTNSTGAVIVDQSKASVTLPVGIHQLTLTVEDHAGETDTDSVTVTILPQPDPPVAAFTHECNDLTCTFAASESTGFEPTFHWDFGDGAEGSGITISHTYNNRDSRTVSLIVEDGIGRQAAAGLDISLRPDLPLTIMSSAFEPGEEIPGRFGCQLAFNGYFPLLLGTEPLPQFGISPPLTLTAPKDAETFVVTILDRVDLGGGPSNFPHWIIYDIPIPSNGTVDIPEMGPPPGTEGMNHFGEVEYLEFCGFPEFSPPVHPFEFIVFALDTTLDLDEGATLQEVMVGIDGHVLDSASFEALYSDKVCLVGASPDTCST